MRARLNPPSITVIASDECYAKKVGRGTNMPDPRKNPNSVYNNRPHINLSQKQIEEIKELEKVLKQELE